MIRVTTPTYILTLPDTAEVDLTEMTEVHFTLAQGKNNKIDKIIEPTDSKTVEVTFSQEDTFNLKDGIAEIQLNWIDASGNRGATSVSTIRIDKQLLNEVLE
jgi:hypothetical protein